MSYTGQVPWHGLGYAVSADLAPLEFAQTAKLDWTVSKHKLKLDGTNVVVPNKYALVRNTDQKILSFVGSAYKPIQNDIAIDFFTKFVKAGHMTMETAGSLHHGRYVWALARIDKEFNVGKGTGRKSDRVKGYLLLLNPHVFGMSFLMQTTAVRVVCWNTLNFALGKGLKGHAGAFRMPHSMVFDDTMKERAEVALGLARSQIDQFADAAKLLASKRAQPDDVKLFFNEVLSFDPEKAKVLKDGRIRVPKMLTRFNDALIMAPGMDIPTAEGTWWGAFNAVTAVVDHISGRERDTALASAWVGYTADIKRRAFRLALDKAV